MTISGHAALSTKIEKKQYKRKFRKLLNKHLLHISKEKAISIVLKMAGVSGEVATALLGLKNYKKYDALLMGRRGKNKRGGAIRTLIRSILKESDLSGVEMRSVEDGVRMFKTLFMRRYANF